MKNILKIIYNYMTNIIKINYVTKIELLNPLFINFFKTIPKKSHYLYYEKDLKYYIVNNITENIMLFNEKCIKKANYLLNKYLLKDLYINNEINNWNICITKNNFMFNYPFTLGNIIFLPYNYIIEYLYGKNDMEYIKTLIHEKIHNYQRYNMNIWDMCIKKHSNWKKIKTQYLHNPENTIYNPDTLYPNNLYYYQYNNTLYFGYLNKQIKPEWIDIKTDEIKNNIELPKYEHPYEELAYNISNDIIKKK